MLVSFRGSPFGAWEAASFDLLRIRANGSVREDDIVSAMKEDVSDKASWRDCSLSCVTAEKGKM